MENCSSIFDCLKSIQCFVYIGSLIINLNVFTKVDKIENFT